VKAERWEPEAIVVMASRFHGVPESLGLAVAETESRFDCKAVGKLGEIGLFQIRPSTAFLMGFAGSKEQLADCTTNAFYGALYLRKAYDSCGKDIPCTISRYNRGIKAKPKPLHAYVKKVKKAKTKVDAWIR
jgi:soluble lytic murein transglycosylase-like protein